MDQLEKQQKEIKKLKLMLLKVKKKHDRDVFENNQEEIIKNQKVMTMLVDKIKEKQRKMETTQELNDLSQQVQSDIESKDNFFAKKSHRTGKKKLHIPTLISFLFITFYGLVCIFQVYFFKQAKIAELTSFDGKDVENLNFLAKFYGIIIFIYFIIYIINYKNLKYKNIVIGTGVVGMLLGMLSYGGIGNMNKFIFSGEGLGVIPGIVLLICSYYLIKNIIVPKTKKIKSLKESKEYMVVETNPDEEKIKELLQLEEIKKKAKQSNNSAS